MLTEGLGLNENLIVLNIFAFPLALVQRFHGEVEHFQEVGVAAVTVAAIGWTVVWAALCRFRYQHLTVTK